jgi:hypothetical protein
MAEYANGPAGNGVDARCAHNRAMPFIVTPLRRRLVMVFLLGLACTGGVIRHQAPDPSTLRDIGTLLLVLWLPAVGNLLAYVIRKIPTRRPRPTAFRPGADFSAHLRIRIDSVSAPADWLAALDPLEQRCTVLVGQSAFTARSAAPLAQWLPDAPQSLALECLVPSAALRELVPGTAFHLLTGTTAVAQGRVMEQVGSR